MNHSLHNLDAFVQHFKDGCKNKEDFKIGIEIEHFIFNDKNETMTYEDVIHIFTLLMKETDSPCVEEGKQLGFYNERYLISIEPAAQLEISIFARSDILILKEIYLAFRKEADEILSEQGYRLVNSGYNPYAKAEELPLIPKQRYAYMDEYFKTTGKFGINMMRATASTQIAIDFENEQDFIKKYRTANVLSPMLALMTDTARVFEKMPYPGHMLRTKIWQDLDPDRCGTGGDCTGTEFGFSDYAKLVYQTPAILLMREEETVYVGKMSACEYYQEKEITEEELIHVLSMMFFDVRLKNYIELRMADSMDADCAFGYAALIKGIFYNQENLNSIYQLFGMVTIEDINIGKNNLIANGYHSYIYGMKTQDAVSTIINTAKRNMNSEESALLEPFEKWVRSTF